MRTLKSGHNTLEFVLYFNLETKKMSLYRQSKDGPPMPVYEGRAMVCGLGDELPSGVFREIQRQIKNNPCDTRQEAETFMLEMYNYVADCWNYNS